VRRIGTRLHYGELRQNGSKDPVCQKVEFADLNFQLPFAATIRPPRSPGKREACARCRALFPACDGPRLADRRVARQLVDRLVRIGYLMASKRHQTLTA
jgi:hypothetical protein